MTRVIWEWTEQLVCLELIDNSSVLCVSLDFFPLLMLTSVIEVTWVRVAISAWGVKKSGVTALN